MSGAGKEQTMYEPVTIDDYDLNRLVAAHVLGWEYRERFPGDTTGYFGSVISEALPAFATEMGAAWQVVERLRSQGWLVCLWTQAQPKDGDGMECVWWCGFSRGEGEEAEAASDYPARAICLASLDAVGVPEWKQVRP